jgi:hypothetical protein
VSYALPVLPRAPQQIRGNARVERSIAFACHDVNGWLFHLTDVTSLRAARDSASGEATQLVIASAEPQRGELAKQTRKTRLWIAASRIRAPRNDASRIFSQRDLIFATGRRGRFWREIWGGNFSGS